ncbi:FUSC family protein [Hufsiella ginkgonis]|nr:FUSC family membrane protein [Hufsiella ginkgonis]
MKQSREIKQFIFSHYFSDGLRIAFGGLLPAVLFAQLGDLDMGINFSLGALTVSIADAPGPQVHKRNAMLFCTLFMIISLLLTGLINAYPVLLAAEIMVLCFFFSMFNIYGVRAASVGTAALLIMVLNIDQHLTFHELLVHGGIMLGGCAWYMVFSLSITGIRPYRLAQQSLALSVRQVADYLRLKALFYDSDTPADETYKKLISQQITVHEHQDSTRELLFKSRLLMKESTNTGRQLVLVFVDVVDLFEQSMATHYDYQAIHKQYGRTGVLESLQSVIGKLADELENLAYYINNNQQPVPVYRFQPELEHLKIVIDQVESEHKVNNLVLKKILVNVRNIVNRLQKIYSYFNPTQLASAKIRSEADLSKFVSHQDYDPKLFLDNLSFKSSVFRYSVRLAIVAVTGYLASKLFPLGHHSYWILLTIIVIVKPGFSLTKQRNFQRVAGTIAGAAIGLLILAFVKDQNARFVFLLIFMILTYSFQRLNYVISVLFMTPYILIMFSFLGMGSLSTAQERIFDTIVGSVIAFTASYLIFPSWESRQLKGFMRALLISNYFYLQKAAYLLAGKLPDMTEYKLARKAVYVNSANMASSFQRMLAEPKSKQMNPKNVHKFIVLNHMLSSYTANLIFHLLQSENRVASSEHVKLVKRALYVLSAAINRLHAEGEPDFKEPEIVLRGKELPPALQTADHKLVSEQLDFVVNVAADIQKIAEDPERV